MKSDSEYAKEKKDDKDKDNDEKKKKTEKKGKKERKRNRREKKEKAEKHGARLQEACGHFVVTDFQLCLGASSALV